MAVSFLTPLFGSILADDFIGRFRVLLSFVSQFKHIFLDDSLCVDRLRYWAWLSLAWRNIFVAMGDA